MLNAETKVSDMAAPLGHTIAAVRARISYLMSNPVWRRGVRAKEQDEARQASRRLYHLTLSGAEKL